MEIWKDIQGYEGLYKISNKGRIKSLARQVIRKDGIPHSFPEKIKKCHLTQKGYLAINLSKKGKHSVPKIHRLLGIAFLKMDKSYDVDHIDGNKLNNNLSNLRPATKSQNRQNTKKQKGNYHSKYKGVSFSNSSPRKKKWVAHIQKNKKVYSLGYFLTQIEAAKAYNEKALELFGEFANLNVI